MRRFIAILLMLVLSLPVSSFAVTEDDLIQKIQQLQRQIEELKKQVEEQQMQEKFQEQQLNTVEKKTEKLEKKWSWLTIGGDYRFRLDSLKGTVHKYYKFNDVLAWMGGGSAPSVQKEYDVKNSSVMFNRFRLKLNAKITENIELKSRLAMYKVWGHETMTPVKGNFFSDRAMGPFDGTVGHVPQDNVLRVDYAYVTWTNIFETPVWFSVGRRASVEGIPTTLRQNTKKIGTAGVAGLLIDYAFDGLTIGVAPYIERLPGFYAKVCYGRGYDSGFKTDLPGSANTKDTDFVGIFVDPVYTDNLNIELNYVRGMDIFDSLPDGNVNGNLGDVDLYGINVIGKIENIGPGDLNLFASAALSKTHPNNNLYMVDSNNDGKVDMGVAGLLYDAPSMGGKKESHTGNAIYVGARYDFRKTKTKIGLEYNRGSKYWLTFAPAADDLWTSKLGTRGDVYEVYVIQELPETPIAKLGKAFVRVGYQYYRFRYTGSNSWVGEPKDLDELTDSPMKGQMLAPLKNAKDFYVTFDVAF